MDMHRAIRVVSADRRGSSRPVVIETEAGRFFTKLRGAAQGPSVLVAELIVAALADALDLLVPARALIRLDDQLVCDDLDFEVTALLRASRGWNLGFRVLEPATEFRADHLERISPDVASKVVWLDGLVMNPDRTSRNPNLLVSGKDLWLIDHGATLAFQHNWAAVTELSPRRSAGREAGHVLASRATRLAEWDGPLAARLAREVIRAAVQTVPDDFLEPLLGPRATPTALARRREAYVAFLWKRLKPPRPFVPTVPT
jgi:hypothetical protein